jgi:hypothetical protein
VHRQLERVVVGVTAGIDVGDGTELLVGPQMRGQGGLLDAASEIAGRIGPGL